MVVAYYNRKLFTFRFFSYRTSFTHKIKKKTGVNHSHISLKQQSSTGKKMWFGYLKAFTLEKVLQH